MELNNLTISSALLISVGGFVTVFFILCIIIALIKLSAKVINKKEVNVKTEQKTVEDIKDDKQLIAVISAAIAASLNTTTDKFVVKEIKKVGKSKSNWMQTY